MLIVQVYGSGAASTGTSICLAQTRLTTSHLARAPNEPDRLDLSNEILAVMANNATSTWVANNTMPSAFIGMAPNTQRDWYIVRGLLRAVGLTDTDPALGYVTAVQPSGTASDLETKRPAVIAGLIVILVAITVVTGGRLILRASTTSMRFGADDWATIAAAVCLVALLLSV